MNRDYYLMRYPSLVKQADEGQAIEEHLGPLQHAYVADAVGADAMQRGLEQASQQDEGGLIDTMMASDAARVAPLQRRIRHGAAGFAESPKTRMVGAVDPTMLLTQNPNASLTNLVMGTGKKDPDQEDLVSERYKQHIRQYQDKDNPEAVETTRETPYHKILQAVMAERDTEVAGDTYLRKNSPWHYWANPFAKSGPISELLNRMERRRIAGRGWPDSALGRAGMHLGEIGTLGLLPQIMGDEEAQESLRRSAVKNKIYPEAAMPDKKAAALLLKCASFLVKQANPYADFDAAYPIPPPNAEFYRIHPRTGARSPMTRQEYAPIYDRARATYGYDSMKAFNTDVRANMPRSKWKTRLSNPKTWRQARNLTTGYGYTVPPPAQPQATPLATN